MTLELYTKFISFVRTIYDQEAATAITNNANTLADDISKCKYVRYAIEKLELDLLNATRTADFYINDFQTNVQNGDIIAISRDIQHARYEKLGGNFSFQYDQKNVGCHIEECRYCCMCYKKRGTNANYFNQDLLPYVTSENVICDGSGYYDFSLLKFKHSFTNRN